MSTIYLVQAEIPYEGADPVKAFRTKPEAEAFSLACTKATESKPKWPHKTQDHPDRASFCALEKAAKKAHPAGDVGWYAKYFVVVEVELIDEPEASRAG